MILLFGCCSAVALREDFDGVAEYALMVSDDMRAFFHRFSVSVCMHVYAYMCMYWWCGRVCVDGV